MQLHFRFHSDHAHSRKGFKIEYQMLQHFTACGGSYSNKSGILTSPLHPHKYPDMAECVYLISQPAGTYINLSFVSMDIDCRETKSDFIEVRDGKLDESPLMGTFCGNKSRIPDFMTSSQNHARIK